MNNASASRPGNLVTLDMETEVNVGELYPLSGCYQFSQQTSPMTNAFDMIGIDGLESQSLPERIAYRQVLTQRKCSAMRFRHINASV